MIVEASTIHPPQLTCGMNRRISTRKASSEASRVGMVRMKSASRKRGEWAGEWKCAATAREKHIKASNAATGWTIKM
jgi:hypothetical protein